MSKTWRNVSVRHSSKNGGPISRSLSTVKRIKTLASRTVVVVSSNLGSLKGPEFKRFDSLQEEDIRVIEKGNMHKRRNRQHRGGRVCRQKHNLLGVMQYTARSIA